MNILKRLTPFIPPSFKGGIEGVQRERAFWERLGGLLNRLSGFEDQHFGLWHVFHQFLEFLDRAG